MTDHFLEKYKKEASESSDYSDEEIIPTLSKKPFSSGIEPSKTTANKYEGTQLYKFDLTPTMRKTPEAQLKMNYGIRRGSQGKPIDNYANIPKPIYKPPDLPNPEKNPINVLKDLAKYESSNHSKINENSLDSNEVTFQWNEQTGSLTLAENKSSATRKSPKEYDRSYVDNQIELEQISKHLMNRSENLESFLKELTNANLDMILFKTRLIREVSNIQSDLKEAHSNILLLMKERVTLKEQLATYKANIKKLTSACKIVQDEIKAYELVIEVGGK